LPVGEVANSFSVFKFDDRFLALSLYFSKIHKLWIARKSNPKIPNFAAPPRQGCLKNGAKHPSSDEKHHIHEV
jgi:hypothetical protein